VAEEFSELENIGSKYLRLYVGFGPEGFEEFVVGDQALGILNQIAENCERARGQRELLVAVPHTLVAKIKPEGSELSHLAD
ncbi:MAG TPA: hypothetical protein VMB19_05090, partial [Silvibacterium sp.]|nr:hypothetical protein [Silvibacterium sp.]